MQAERASSHGPGPLSPTSSPPGLAGALLAALQDGVVLLDRDGVVVECNRHLCTLTGFARAEIVGRRAPLPWWGPELRARATGSSVESGVEAEATFRHKDGTPLDLCVSSSGLEGENGEPLGSVVTYKDVTAGRRAEAQARAEREQYRALSRAYPAEWVAVFDEHGRTLLVEGRRAAEHPDALEGRALDELLPDALRERVPAAVAGALAGRPTHLRTGDDEVYELQVVPVDAGSGRARGVAVCRDVTAEQRSAGRLHELAERLEEAQHVAGVGSWQLDLETHTRTLSAESFRIFGVAPDADPAFVDDLILPDDRASVGAGVAAAERSGSEFDETYRIRRPSGEVRVVRGRGQVLHRGGRRQLVGTVQDVTELARAQQAERAQFARLAAMVEVQQEIATTEADPAGVMRLVAEQSQTLTVADGAVVELIDGSELVCRAATGAARPALGLRVPLHGTLSGLAVREGALQRCDDAEHDPRAIAEPDALLGLRSMLAVPLRQGRRVIGVLRVLAFAPDSFEDSDAHVLQLLCELISAAVARARNNAAQELLVDELRSAVAALEESEGRVRRILAGAHEAFVATDELDRITDWNPAAEATFGWSAHEAKGRRLEELILPAESRQAHVLGRRGFRATGQADIVGRRLELEVLHRDGRRFPVELTLTANHLRRGIGFSVFLHDISERKHHDAQRERLLQQERAHVERLRELDQIKDRLVSAVSHELRTPLTSITGYVDLLLEEDGLGGDARGFLEVVQRNAERLLRLVGDLLDLYRLDNQGLAAGAVPTELGGLVTRAVDAIRPAALGKDIDIRLDVRPVIVDGDATRLAQAVDNVLSNAVKYTPEGGSVRVTLAERPGEAWLAIADDGIGIPAADRERLFERFYRSADAVREGVPGTGLGLALTREILNAHGGSIEHADGAEGGSTFVIRLPAPGLAAHAA